MYLYYEKLNSELSSVSVISETKLDYLGDNYIQVEKLPPYTDDDNLFINIKNEVIVKAKESATTIEELETKLKSSEEKVKLLTEQVDMSQGAILDLLELIYKNEKI